MNRTRPTGSILGTTVSAAVALMLGAAAVVLAAVFLASLFGVARFVPVLSNSMAPDMPKGSLAVTTPVPREEVATGDVVVFTAPDGTGRRVIHRVQHVYGADEAQDIDGWTADRLHLSTGGDNNPSIDPWIVTIADETIWRESMVVPAIGWPAIWLADPAMRMALFFLAGAGVVAWALVTIWQRNPEAAATIDRAGSPDDGLHQDGDAGGTGGLRGDASRNDR